jgi:tRNA (cmo5U34)-methyltransferase
MQDRVWQSAEVVDKYLSGVRGAIPLADTQLEIMLRIIQHTQSDVRRVLDLGCGDGILGRVILERYPHAEAVFLDFSEPMLAACRAKTHSSAPLHFIQGDYGLPGWVESIKTFAPFDVIVSGFSIHHQPDERKYEVYQEMYHLLRLGGVFLNLEHVSSCAAWIEQLFSEIFIDHLHKFHSSIDAAITRETVAVEFYNRPDKAANILAPLETQCEWLREIGFVDVDCFLKIFELALFGGLKPAST